MGVIPGKNSLYSTLKTFDLEWKGRGIARGGGLLQTLWHVVGKLRINIWLPNYHCFLLYNKQKSPVSVIAPVFHPD